jgi:branched-chain amino acid transport system ATP-binding protein
MDSPLINYQGQAITQAATYRRARLGIRLCPEGRGVFADLSVEENLLLGLPLRRRRSKLGEEIERIYEILPALRLRARQHAGSLSGGEQQMLSIGRALITGPTLLICDELSLGLAPKFIDDLYEVLVRANESGVAILLIEQNVHRALAITDQVYVLNRGLVTYAGLPQPLFDDEVLSQAYFSTEAVTAPAVASPPLRRSGW